MPRPRQTEVCRTSFGTEGEIRTLEASLEDSHVSSYITSAKGISNWNPWQDSNPQPRRSKRRALPVELQERREFRISDFELRISVQSTAGPSRRTSCSVANPQSEIPEAPVAQLEERDASNVEVAGSNPARSSKSNVGFRIADCGFKHFAQHSPKFSSRK